MNFKDLIARLQNNDYSATTYGRVWISLCCGNRPPVVTPQKQHGCCHSARPVWRDSSLRRSIQYAMPHHGGIPQEVSTKHEIITSCYDIGSIPSPRPRVQRTMLDVYYSVPGAKHAENKSTYEKIRAVYCRCTSIQSTNDDHSMSRFTTSSPAATGLKQICKGLGSVLWPGAYGFSDSFGLCLALPRLANSADDILRSQGS